MSHIGNIRDSYGKQFSIAVANTYSYNVLTGSNLPANTLIIASNVDESLNDTGTYSLIATDSSGNPARITYSISEGNGLYYSEEDDALSMHIDNVTIKNSTGGLYFDLSYVLSDDFNISGNSVNINMNNIPSATKTNLGVARIDGKTLRIDGDILYVATDSLNYANNETHQYGIGIGDGKTIVTTNGKVTLNVDTLSKATNEEYGLLIGGDNTVHIEDGIISVNTQGLSFASEDKFGISKPDNQTIIFNENDDITVNEEKLDNASTANYGLVRIDSSSLTVKDGKISMRDYDKINSYISKYTDTVAEYKKKIDEYNDFLSSGNILFKDKDIQLFVINETSVAELVHPKSEEEVINMPLQTVSAVFDIITTCDFILSIQFEQGTNEFPNVDILEVNYNDEKLYTKEQALDIKTVYPSTEGQKKKLTIKFTAKNYRNSIKTQYVVTSVNIMIANNEDHIKSKSEKYSIVRYNSLYELMVKGEEEEEKKDREYIIDQGSIFWRKTKSAE